MAFSRLVFTVLLATVSCYANDVVPVFMWGDQVTPIKVNALEAVPTTEFAGKISELIADDPFTIVFIEPTLSPEDISSKNADGTSPLSYLAQQAKTGRFSYLPAVESPVLAIDENAALTEIDFINLSENEAIADIKSSNRRFLFINLKDAKEGETRAEMLARHDEYMRETFENLNKQYTNLIAIYTAMYPSWVITESHSRVRRQASNETQDYILDRVRLYVELIQLREGDVIHNLTENPSSTSEVNNELHTMNTTVKFGDHSFVMNFRTQGGYWFFDSVTLDPGTTNETLYPTIDSLFALEGFSYRCGQKTSFTTVTNSTRSLTFNNLQLQPFFTPINSSVQFGATFDCVGFFSGAIWAGLMVTFILLAITFYGIMMMMDIRTMDRFDDPKGKTITINASE